MPVMLTDMEDKYVNQNTGVATGGHSGFVTGRPTVAGNAGTEVSSKLLGAFEPSGASTAEFIRLPAPGARCRISGLSRTTLNEAIERGDIRAITVRRPGATRGIKLIRRASLLAWLAKLDAEQNGAGTKELAP